MIQKNTSFINTYYFWSYVLISIVFFNYILFRAVVIDSNSFLYLITFILDYAVLIIFFMLVFYKFYNSIFNSQLLLASTGILFLILGTLKLYSMDIKTYNLVELSFFILTLILTIELLAPLILNKNMNEIERGVYIFAFLTLLSSNINYILISANKTMDNEFFHFLSIYISNYTSKLSSFSYIILMTAYVFIFIKDVVIKNINKSFVLVTTSIVLSAVTIYIFGSHFFLMVVSFFSALGIIMYLPFVFYLVLIIMFLITLFTSFITCLLSKNYYSILIAFTLFMLAGIDISNFSLRLISIFSIMELLSIYEKDHLSYLTNNNL